MPQVKISSKDQSGGITANRVNSPEINQKIIVRYRVEGFVVGILLSIVVGVIGNMVYDWLFK